MQIEPLPNFLYAEESYQDSKKPETCVGAAKHTWEEKGKSKPCVDPQYIYDGPQCMPADLSDLEKSHEEKDDADDKSNSFLSEETRVEDTERNEEEYHETEEILEVETMETKTETQAGLQEQAEDSKTTRPSSIGKFISSIQESIMKAFGLGNRNPTPSQKPEKLLDKSLYQLTLKTLYHSRCESPGVELIDDDSGSDALSGAETTGHMRRQPSEFTTYKGCAPLTESLHKRWLKRNTQKTDPKAPLPVAVLPNKKFKTNLIVMMASVPPQFSQQQSPQMPRARIEANKCKRCRKERKQCVCRFNLAGFMSSLQCSSMPGRTDKNLDRIPGLKNDYEVFEYDREKWPHTDLGRSFDTVAVLPARWPNYYAWDPTINIISPEMFFMPRKFPWFRSQEVRRIIIHKTVMPYLEGLMRDLAAVRSKGALTPSIAAQTMGREYPNRSFGIVVDGVEVVRVTDDEDSSEMENMYQRARFERAIMKTSLLTVYTDYDLYNFDRNVFFQYSPGVEIIVQGEVMSEEAREKLNLAVNEETVFGHFTHRTQSHHEIDYIDREEPRTFNMYHILTKIGGSLHLAPETLYNVFSILSYSLGNLTSMTVEVNVLKQAFMRMKPNMDNVGWGSVSNEVPQDDYVPKLFGPTRAFERLRTLKLYPGKDTLVVDYQFMVKEINERMPALQELQTTHLIDSIEPTVSTLEGLQRRFAKCKVLACFPQDVQFGPELRTDFPLMYLPAVTDLEVFVQDYDTGSDSQGQAEYVAAFLANLNVPNLHTLVHRNLPFSWCSESIFESLSARSNTNNQVTGMQRMEVMLREPEDYMHLLKLLLKMPFLQHLNVISEANKELYKTGSYMQKIAEACNVLSLFQDVDVMNDTILSDFREREVIESKARFYIDDMDLKKLVLRNENHMLRAHVLDNTVFDSMQFILHYMSQRFQGDKETGEVMAHVVGNPLQTLMRSKDGHRWKTSEWGDIMYELSAIEALVMQLENVESLEYFALRTQCTAVASPRLFRMMVTHPRLRQVLVDEPTRRLWPEQKLDGLNIAPYVMLTEADGNRKNGGVSVDGVEWLGPRSMANMPPWVRAVVDSPSSAVEWSKIEYLRKYRLAGLNYVATRVFGQACVRAYTRPLEVQGLTGRATCGHAANTFVIDAAKVRRIQSPKLDASIAGQRGVVMAAVAEPAREVLLEDEEGGPEVSEFTLERYMALPAFLPRIDIEAKHEFDGVFNGWIKKKV